MSNVLVCIFYKSDLSVHIQYFWFLGFIKITVAQQIEEATKVAPEPQPEPVKIKTVRKRNKFVVPEGPNFETTGTGILKCIFTLVLKVRTMLG